jgi:uncharacterized membrane protein YebE (DUF533 family)
MAEMTNEQIIAFLSKPEVIKNLKNLKSEEDIRGYLKENGIEVDLKKSEIIKKALATIDSYEGKLSDEQLDEIAGGTSVGKIMAGIVLGTAAVATIAGGGKFAYDVYNEYEDQGTFTGKLKDSVHEFAEETGTSTRSTYRQAVSDTARWLRASTGNDE